MTTTLTPVFGDRTREGSAAFTMRHPRKELAQTLGYDPRPAVRTFRGNWLPPCYYPLPMTEISARIALRVWWNGPAWTILRKFFLFPLAGMGLRCTRAHGLRTGRTSQGAMAARHRRRGPGRGVPRRHDAMGAAIRQDRAPGVHRLAGRGAPSRLSTDGEADQGTVSRSGAVLQRAIPSQSARLTPI